MDERITVTKASLPNFEEYVEMIRPLWESRWITNMGTYHAQLEKELCEYMRVPHLSLLVNGHMSLELTIQAMNFPEGSEIITTPFTFISTTHAIVRNRLKPVFCDIRLDDYTIDENKIEALITEKTVAIIPVHVYGNICNVEKIEQIANSHNLKVIYDAAHAFGETYKGKGIGTFGNASIFSFHATKVFNTIEGGAVSFSDPTLYERLYNLKNFGIRSEELVTEIGSNAKMNEFCAAMGLCNLKYFSSNVSHRKECVKHYLNALRDCPGIVLPHYNRNEVEYTYGYFPILFIPPSEKYSASVRDTVYSSLREHNIFPRKYFYPLTSDEACFQNKYYSLPLENARYAADNILVLPLYSDLSSDAIDFICSIIKKICGGVNDD